jgi:hypothetical protein
MFEMQSRYSDMWAVHPAGAGGSMLLELQAVELPFGSQACVNAGAPPTLCSAWKSAAA